MIPLLGKAINFKDYTSAHVDVHWMPWFGTPGHIKISYDSADIAVCDAQCASMKAQGIDGVNVDYYGPDSPSGLAALRMLNACERAGLSYSTCIDHGALTKKLKGDAATAEYIRILKFMSETVFLSPAYRQDASGRALVNFFGEAPGVNWTAVRAGIDKKLAFLWEGGIGFSHTESDGAFGWVNPLDNHADPNMPAIQTFATAAAASKSKIAIYPVYPGFDDTMASWGSGRIMSRRLGQTTLDTLHAVPADAESVMIETWNDYEEGTAIELSQG